LVSLSHSVEKALNQGRGNDPWRMGILTHPYMAVGSHAHSWSLLAEESARSCMQSSINSTIPTVGLLSIWFFLSHFSGEENRFESSYLSPPSVTWSAARRKAPYSSCLKSKKPF